MINVGESFLHYKVLSRLGTGGMGEVYLARDGNLGRKVAIKILRKKYGENAESLRRFVLEAKSASALNHPNIITIYEIGEYGESNYIASEFIEGKTLHAHLENYPLPVSEILRLAIQTVEAIAAAHAAGIVHRDIKPENVMVRSDGYVKILDFGLAKLTELNRLSADFDEETQTLIETNPGMIMGTVAYMSPEQARAREVDERSDIWSVGVLLYEMITGVRPFSGETTSDTLAAILRSEPEPMSRFAPDVPGELEHIVAKALRKDREERYQNIRDMLIDLRDLDRELDMESRSGRTVNQITDGSPRAPSTDEVRFDSDSTRPSAGRETHSISDMFVSQFRQHPTGMTVAAAAVIFVLAAAALGVKMLVDASFAEHSFQTMRLTKLTTSGKLEGEQIAVAPDGKYVAYAAKENGLQSLWVRNVASSSNVEIIPPADVEYGGLTFSLDGGYIFYAVRPKDGIFSINSIPVLGGDYRRIVADAMGPVSFSPDGRQFAFSRGEKELMISDADGKNVSSLTAAADGRHWRVTAWSPDGKHIVSGSYSPQDSLIRLFRISVDGGHVEAIKSPPWLRVNGLAWLPDGSGLLLSGRDAVTQRSQIWQLGYPGGELKRVTNDLSNYLGVSLTSDGKSLLSIQHVRQVNIWAGDSREADTVRQVTKDVGRDDGLSGVAWSPDGRIVFTTRLAGDQDIWIVNADGSGERRLTADSRSNFQPVVSPDSNRIAFVSSRGGNFDLWTMSMDGTDPVQMTQTSGIEGRPVYTSDGLWILYQRIEGDNASAIWKIPVGGGEPIRLTDGDADLPSISPDGKVFACRYRPGPADKNARIAIFSMDTAVPRQILDLPEVAQSPLFRWSADGRNLLFVEKGVPGSGTDLRSQSLSGGPSVLISELNGDRVYWFDFARVGNALAVARGMDSSDGVMITEFR